VIKRFRFLTGTGRSDHAGRLIPAAAPADLRPVRIVLCSTIIELEGPQPRHDAVGIEWFADLDHLRRFEAWSTASAADESPAPDVAVVVAHEHALRGAQWLEARWRAGGPKFKHMAVALRAESLTPAEFAERWRDHAGSLQRPGSAPVRIPDAARGQAYLQNHPIPRAAGQWPYDAVNEVYFDTVAALRTRIEWFAANLSPDRSDDFIRKSWLIAVREEIVLG
jgi:hypothetical protein